MFLKLNAMGFIGSKYEPGCFFFNRFQERFLYLTEHIFLKRLEKAPSSCLLFCRERSSRFSRCQKKDLPCGQETEALSLAEPGSLCFEVGRQSEETTVEWSGVRSWFVTPGG